jgi:flagellar basal-body rod modification protein FlgD
MTAIPTSTMMAASMTTPTSTGSSSTSGSSTTVPSNLQLNPSDFINMLVTQLENQDPLNPTSSQDLLSQVSDIGQLESTDQLQSTMTTLSQQSSIGAAASLIGKTVNGQDSSGNALSGSVTSVQVAGGTVSLQLSGGSTLALSNVTSITSGS